MKKLSAVVVIAFLIGGYILVESLWSYSSGERAGWIQKFSHKGWLCKTWEGEMVMVSLPGSIPEKFYFTVWSDDVAEQIKTVMGKRVSVRYEEKAGIPTRCFGETRHYVTGVSILEDIPLAPGVVVPMQPPAAAPADR